MPDSGARARSELRERLQARREEIEAAALARVAAISDPAEVADPAYTEGLRVAVSAAVEYGIETTGRDGAGSPVPVALLAQARLAARYGIPLDTVLRRYFAGYSLLGYFILEEATHAGLVDGADLKRLLGAHAGTFDRLLAAVGEEHARESESAARPTVESKRIASVERLLAGEPADTSNLRYDFDRHHTAVVATGPRGAEAARSVAAQADCQLLLVRKSRDTTWAWLGTRRALDPDRLVSCALGELPHEHCSVAVGEVGTGLAGWRFSHLQALAALPVVQRANRAIVRYADVALVASALGDDLLASSLKRIYVEPLEQGAGREGDLAKAALRAYFDADRNISKAAAAVGVNRNTFASRLRAFEQRIGRRLSSSATDLEVALSLDSLSREKGA